MNNQPQLLLTNGDIDGVIAIGHLPLVNQLHNANYNFKNPKKDSQLNGLVSLPEHDQYTGFTLYPVGWAGELHYSLLTNMSQGQLEIQLLTFIYESNSREQVGIRNAWLFNDDPNINPDNYIAGKLLQLRSAGSTNTITITPDFLTNFRNGNYHRVGTDQIIYGAVVEMGQKMPLQQALGQCAAIDQTLVEHSVVHFGYEFGQEGHILHLNYKDCSDVFNGWASAKIFHPLGNHNSCTVEFPPNHTATHHLKYLLKQGQNEQHSDSLDGVTEVRIYIPELKNVRPVTLRHGYHSKGMIGALSVFSELSLPDGNYYLQRYWIAQNLAEAITAGIGRAGEDEGLRLRLEFVCSNLNTIDDNTFSDMLRARVVDIFPHLLVTTPPNMIRQHPGINGAVHIVRNPRFAQMPQVFAAEAYLTYLLDGNSGERVVHSALQAALGMEIRKALLATKNHPHDRIHPVFDNFQHVTHERIVHWGLEQVRYRIQFHLFPGTANDGIDYARALWDQSQMDHSQHDELIHVLRTALSVFKAAWRRPHPFCDWKHWKKNKKNNAGKDAQDRSFADVARCLLFPRKTAGHALAFVESLLKGWFLAHHGPDEQVDQVQELVTPLQSQNLLDGQTQVLNCFPMLRPTYTRDTWQKFVGVGEVEHGDFYYHQQQMRDLLPISYERVPDLEIFLDDEREIRAWGLLDGIVQHARNSPDDLVKAAFRGRAKKRLFAYTWILVIATAKIQRDRNKQSHHPFIHWQEVIEKIRDVTDHHLKLLTSLGLISRNGPYPNQRKERTKTLFGNWIVTRHFPTRVSQLADNDFDWSTLHEATEQQAAQAQAHVQEAMEAPPAPAPPALAPAHAPLPPTDEPMVEDPEEPTAANPEHVMDEVRLSPRPVPEVPLEEDPEEQTSASPEHVLNVPPHWDIDVDLHDLHDLRDLQLPTAPLPSSTATLPQPPLPLPDPSLVHAIEQLHEAEVQVEVEDDLAALVAEIQAEAEDEMVDLHQAHFDYLINLPLQLDRRHDTKQSRSRGRGVRRNGAWKRIPRKTPKGRRQ